jgi:SAM-dependent methyltransferase
VTERVRVDYDALAPTYDKRYEVGPLTGISAAVRELAAGRDRILEAGCGTGRWLREASGSIGLDASFGMIRQAAGAPRVVALANALPFTGRQFDLIFCVNAIHHFDDPRRFVHDAAALLRRGGKTAVIGIDPRLLRGRRYYYEFFEGSYERDLARYPAFGDIVQWMIEAGYDPIEYRVIERADVSVAGEAIWSDPFLANNSNSLLELLTNEEYNAGLERIRDALKENGPEFRFRAEVDFALIAGQSGL